jgi:hypothetical protein
VILFVEIKIVFVLFINLESVPFRELQALLFDSIFFVGVELEAFADESDVRPLSFNLAVLHFLLVF